MIVAAGRGTRADRGPDAPKQFRSLAGKPLIEWSLDAFVAAGCDHIVLVVPGAALDRARKLRYSGSVVFAAGGETRQDSVASGLEEVSAELVLVHDAARPFVTRGLISEVLAELDVYDGSIPALPSDETVKDVRNQEVFETVDRANLWAVQTPQGFRTEVLRRAHEKARSEDFVGTDDAMLVERYGGRVKVIQGSRTNLKITHPEDFQVAEALARVMQG